MPNVLRTSFAVFNGLAPMPPSETGGGPKALPIDFDFTAVGSVTHYLTLENEQGVIDFVQSVWIDNSANAQALTLVFGGTNQKIVCRAGAQGMFPVLSVNPVRLTISSTIDPTAVGSIALINVPMAYTENGPISVTANISTITTVTAFDVSGFIAAGGTSQALLAANANRKGFIVQNPPNEIEPLYINFTDAANFNTSIAILPGESFPPNGSPYVSREAININAATTNHPFVAKEFTA